MEMMISRRNMDLSESLRAAAHDKVTRVARHLDGWEEAEIHFFEEKNPRIADKEVCEVTLRGHGHVLRAKAASPDPFTSVDRVVDKLGHQVEKLKTRLTKRTHRAEAKELDAKASAGLPAWAPVEGVSLNGAAADDEDEAGGGKIVKVKRFDLKPMTPEEAVLHLEMLGHTFYFFTNADSDSAAVVYRRGDGDFGLIDAAES